MTLDEIQTQIEELEALPHQAAIVTVRLLGLNLWEELDKAWFESEKNRIEMSRWSDLYERATVIQAGPPQQTQIVADTLKALLAVSLAEQKQAIA